MSMLRLVLLLVAAPLLARAQDAAATAKVTSIFIDTVSGYDELSTCAEEVLSTIVRGQYSGCGDKGAVTSYTCFCTDSSSLMSNLITRAISNRCESSIVSEQASSAIDVFDAYCAIGVPGDRATTTTAGIFHNGRHTCSTCVASSYGGNNRGIGDSCGFGSGFGFGLRFFNPDLSVSPEPVNEPFESPSLMWCRRRRRHEQLRSEKHQQLESTSGAASSRPEFRWPARVAGTTQELPTQYHNHEMPTHEHIVSPGSSGYDVSPLPFAPSHQKQPVYQVRSEKMPYQQQEPQELPAGIEDRHELDGSPSPLSSTGRLSYRTHEK
ncbi:hypothetical protein DHEL01_v206542 [Diaporthe helianthi]|uniref:Uncharacterized protein n=1 Tax=Diaporthe helianthi TaxID=158607 RepID=A0A2P5HXT4_DIAHE|nr:hypothetical protein DHEL01_v206542 [Diaporthe helianthi]